MRSGAKKPSTDSWFDARYAQRALRARWAPLVLYCEHDNRPKLVWGLCLDAFHIEMPRIYDDVVLVRTSANFLISGLCGGSRFWTDRHGEKPLRPPPEIKLMLSAHAGRLEILRPVSSWNPLPPNVIFDHFKRTRFQTSRCAQDHYLLRFWSIPTSNHMTASDPREPCISPIRRSPATSWSAVVTFPEVKRNAQNRSVAGVRNEIVLFQYVRLILERVTTAFWRQLPPSLKEELRRFQKPLCFNEMESLDRLCNSSTEALPH